MDEADSSNPVWHPVIAFVFIPNPIVGVGLQNFSIFGIIQPLIKLERSKAMGKVIVKNVILRNHEDELQVKFGLKKESEVRSIALDMIADSGARAVGLPKWIIEKLGLPLLRTVDCTLADGSVRKAELYNELTVMIDDRVAWTQCIAKPENAPKLLGQLVFEQIDYVIDCPNERLMPNPEARPGVMHFDDF